MFFSSEETFAGGKKTWLIFNADDLNKEEQKKALIKVHWTILFEMNIYRAKKVFAWNIHKSSGPALSWFDFTE